MHSTRSFDRPCHELVEELRITLLLGSNHLHHEKALEWGELNSYLCSTTTPKRIPYNDFELSEPLIISVINRLSVNLAQSQLSSGDSKANINYTRNYIPPLILSSLVFTSGTVEKKSSSLSHAYSAQYAQFSMAFSFPHFLISHTSQ